MHTVQKNSTRKFYFKPHSSYNLSLTCHAERIYLMHDIDS